MMHVSCVKAWLSENNYDVNLIAIENGKIHEPEAI